MTLTIKGDALDDFGREVRRRAREGFYFEALVLDDLRVAEVDDFDHPWALQHYVRELDVSVDYFLQVQVLDRVQNLQEELLVVYRLGLGKRVCSKKRKIAFFFLINGKSLVYRIKRK